MFNKNGNKNYSLFKTGDSEEDIKEVIDYESQHLLDLIQEQELNDYKKEDPNQLRLFEIN